MSLSVIPVPGFSDPVSSISHLLAACCALYAAPALLRRGRGSPLLTVALAVYAFSLVNLFTMSCLYHMLEAGGAPRATFRRMDYAAIWLLIAGTFTPFAVQFRQLGIWRWGVLSLAWAVALHGVLIEVGVLDRPPPWVHLGLFLGLGWLEGIALAAHILPRYGLRALGLLVGGGLAYTLGAVSEQAVALVLVPGVVEGHEVFHLAVMAGAYLQGCCVARYVSREPRAPVQASQPVPALA